MAQGKKLNCKIISNGIEYEITTSHPIYNLRYTIMTRCYNAALKDYKFYQGKGIKVCDKWKNDFISFFQWCMDNGWKKGLVLDRIDNDKDYSPDNCRFITFTENLQQVIEIRKRLALKIPAKYIAQDFNVSASTIGAIKRGQNWKQKE